MVDRPIFSTASAPRFPDELEALARALAHVLEDSSLPEPSMISMGSGAPAMISAWLPGAPVTAVLTWARHMTDIAYTIKPHRPYNGRPVSGGQLAATGRLHGVPVEVTASTTALPEDVDPLNYDAQPLPEDAVRYLAAREVWA